LRLGRLFFFAVLDVCAVIGESVDGHFVANGKYDGCCEGQTLLTLTEIFTETFLIENSKIIATLLDLWVHETFRTLPLKTFLVTSI